MTLIYHGGATITGEIQKPLFLYEDISHAIYFAIGYSGVEDTHISEFKLNEQSKVLDLTINIEVNQKIVDDIMFKAGLIFEGEDLFVKDSYQYIGREIQGYDVDLTLFPTFRKEMLKAGFNVLKTDTAFENSLPVAYSIVDTSVIDLNKQYVLTRDDDNVYLKVALDNNLNQDQNNLVGKTYIGATGYGDIVLEEVSVEKKNKKNNI